MQSSLSAFNCLNQIVYLAHALVSATTFVFFKGKNHYKDLAGHYVLPVCRPEIYTCTLSLFPDANSLCIYMHNMAEFFSLRHKIEKSSSSFRKQGVTMAPFDPCIDNPGHVS